MRYAALTHPTQELGVIKSTILSYLQFLILAFPMRCDRPHLIRTVASLTTPRLTTLRLMTLGLMTLGLLLNNFLPAALAQQYIPPERGLPQRLGDGGTRVGSFGRPSGVDAPIDQTDRLELDAPSAQPAPRPYEPAAPGLPNRRDAGGTRGGGSCIRNQEDDLVALMPADSYGQTLSGYPTLFWSIPQTEAEAIEFVLLDEAANEIYRTTLHITGEANVIRLSLPVHAGLPPLEVGALHRWYFALVCDPADRSADIYTEGWIQRVEPTAELTAEIEAAAVSDRPAIYAVAGLWHDALSAIAEQRYANPEDVVADASWRSLLESVDLDVVVDHPLHHAD
jgi:hypothetical protein